MSTLAPCRSDPAVRSPAAAQHWPAGSYSYISSYPRRRVRSAPHMQMVLCCVDPSIHPSKSTDTKRASKKPDNNNNNNHKKRDTHKEHTPPSLPMMPKCRVLLFLLLNLHLSDPSIQNQQPMPPSPSYLPKTGETNPICNPSIHPSTAYPACCLLACWLPIYHRPPCEPAEETNQKKRIKKRNKKKQKEGIQPG